MSALFQSKASIDYLIKKFQSRARTLLRNNVLLFLKTHHRYVFKRPITMLNFRVK